MRDPFVIAATRALLPEAAQRDFDSILADVRARRVSIDPEPVVLALFQANIVRDEPLPDHLVEVAQGSLGRGYQLLLQMKPNPCSTIAMRGYYARRRAECERVYELVQDGKSITEGWEIATRESDLAYARSKFAGLRARRRASHVARAMADEGDD